MQPSHLEFENSVLARETQQSSPELSLLRLRAPGADSPEGRKVQWYKALTVRAGVKCATCY